MCIYPTPQLQTGCNTRPIFKQSTVVGSKIQWAMPSQVWILFAAPCWICKVVYACTQLWSKQSCQTRIPLEEKEEDYLLSVWLWTYGHIIAWAVTSDCEHLGTSLHGLWHLIVHIQERNCMDIMAASAIIILQLEVKVFLLLDWLPNQGLVFPTIYS